MSVQFSAVSGIFCLGMLAQSALPDLPKGLKGWGGSRNVPKVATAEQTSSVAQIPTTFNRPSVSPSSPRPVIPVRLPAYGISS